MPRNINPRHTFAEMARFNKARQHCHLYIDMTLRKLYIHGKPPVEPNLTNADIQQRVSIFNPTTMPTCHILHGARMCSVDYRCWQRDFFDRHAQDNYESEYETEDDAERRLSGGDDDPGSSFGHPGSSFGPNYPGGSQG